MSEESEISYNAYIELVQLFDPGQRRVTEQGWKNQYIRACIERGHLTEETIGTGYDYRLEEKGRDLIRTIKERCIDITIEEFEKLKGAENNASV